MNDKQGNLDIKLHINLLDCMFYDLHDISCSEELHSTTGILPQDRHNL